ncbi:MAG: hypothetical protein Kow00127_24170 [Bacteroidales bacterium]
MKRLLLSLLIVCNQIIAFSQTNYWVGNNTNWHDPNNWSLLHVPNATENATIPEVGVTYFPNIYATDAECKNLTIVGGANIELYNGRDLDIYGEANISGELSFGHPGSTVTFHQDVFWWSGSESRILYSDDLNSYFEVLGDWTFGAGSNVVMMDNQVTMFMGSGTQYLYNYSSTSSFGYFSVLGDLTVDASTSQDLQVDGLYIGSSELLVWNASTDLIIQVDFQANGWFQFNNGGVVFNYLVNDIYIQPGSYFNDVTINDCSLTHGFYNQVVINGDLTINDNGVSFPNQLEIRGNYDNNTWTTISINEITFTGTDTQNAWSLQCETLILNKSGGELRFLGENSECNHYDWQQGFMRVAGGYFVINDLVDDGIYGTISVTSGQLHIYQDPAQFIDLNGTFFMAGGACYIYGGADDSWWSYDGDATVTIQGGTLDFVDNGVRVYNSPSHTLTTNITGGVIRTAGDFRIENNFATATGDNTVELYGPNDCIISTTLGEFDNLRINKSTTAAGPKNYPRYHRIPKTVPFSKSGMVTCEFSDIWIAGDFILDQGTFASPEVIHVGRNWENNAGPDNFFENIGMVEFYGDEPTSYLFGPEVFVDLNVNKSSMGLVVEMASDVEVKGNFEIIKGDFRTASHTLLLDWSANVHTMGILEVQADGVLLLDNSTLQIEGYIYTIGYPGHYATITSTTLNSYSFVVKNGGGIGAEHTIFERMGSSGIYLQAGAIIVEPFTFNNCIFRAGYTNGYKLLVLNTDQAFTATNVRFENLSTTPVYNVWRPGTTGDVTFVNAGGDFAGPEYEYDPNQHVHWTDMDLEFDFKIALEGPFNGTTMNTTLNSEDLIPASQPYYIIPGVPWYYNGTESVSSMPPGVVDWILVDILDAAEPSVPYPGTLLERRALLLLEDGSVRELDGTSRLMLSGMTYEFGLVARIWHRNHLGVMTSGFIPRVDDVYTWDFTTSAGQAYGTDALKHIGPGIYGLYSGDADGNQSINESDLINIWDLQSGTNGYLQSDFDLDGKADNIDKNDFWYPNLGETGQAPD